MFVKEVMKKDVKIISSNATVHEAAQKMTQNHIGCLIVVNETLEGIVTERDILNKIVATGRDPKQVNISEIMTKNVITISPDQDIEVACELMAKHRIKRLPVVLGDEVLGIITSTDVVAILSHVVKEIYSQQ
jgi:CBS domain-containing protein